MSKTDTATAIKPVKIAKHHRKALKDKLTSPDTMSDADVDAFLSALFGQTDADDSTDDDN